MIDDRTSHSGGLGPALITGAGRGIGKALALRLAATGSAVALVARSVDQLRSTAALIEERGGSATVLPCDLTDEGEIEAMVERAAEELGGLRIVVNNAGGAHRVLELDELDGRTFALGTSLNYTAVYRVMHAAAPYLFRAAPGSSVLNIVSIAAERGLPGMAYYSGAKAGVVALTRAVAREWGPRGVRANCIAPGWIDTELSRPLLESGTFSERTLSEVPMQRWGTPEEVADVGAFLVSDLARYVTGSTINVDGGFLA